MKKFILILILPFIFIVSNVFAGFFTITTTSTQDAVLIKLLNRINVIRASENPPKLPITVNQMVNKLLQDIFKSKVIIERNSEHRKNKSKWKSRNQVQRNQIQSILDQ